MKKDEDMQRRELKVMLRDGTLGNLKVIGEYNQEKGSNKIKLEIDGKIVEKHLSDLDLIFGMYIF